MTNISNDNISIINNFTHLASHALANADEHMQ